MSVGIAVAATISGTLSLSLPVHDPIALAAHDDLPGAGTDGEPGDASAIWRTIRIEAGDMFFKPRSIPIRPGETVRLVIFNSGKLRHEFVIASHAEHLEHRAMMRRMPDMTMGGEPNAVTVDPGQSKELVWKFGNDPKVEFSCDIPGHADAGMTGIFRAVR
jgi:uncharacterized cupredoxin-like copper-binding protein